MLKMVDGTGIIGLDMVCPLGGTVSPPQPPNYDKVEMEGVGSLMLPNSLKAPLERVELIGNSVQGENPAPDNPQEIKSAGRKSKNLLNLQKQPDVKETYLGWKVSDGRNVVLSVKDKGNNADITGCHLGLSRTGGSSDGVVWVVNNGSAVIKEVVSKNQYVSVFPSNETTVRKLLERFDVQVEYGNNATDYEPYGYLLDVKVTGKNLFDITKYDKYDDTWTNTTYTTKKLKLKPNTTYTMSCKRLVDKPKQYAIFRVAEGITSGNGIAVQINPDLSINYFLAVGTFTTNDTGEITLSYYVDCPKEQYWFTEVIGDIQIEEGNKATPYEPYTEQTVQIALDEPLRGVGEYKDVLTKDGVVRKIKRIVFDGSEDERWVINNERENVIRFIPHQLGDAIKINDYQRSMIDKLKWVSGVWNRDEVGQDMFAGILRINMPKTLTPDLQTFKTWLSHNPLTVDYVLAEPVTELLPESVQDQLSALHSENGVTHVFVDSGEVPCGIKLTYRKEK